ncbi:FtsK/SpoIIIE domain-containing protein [Latilactobacillus fuchuensis]|uniref:FtsK/SpoIIIE domain-containing protein n=1 Tax=Latilactobacillus fuchuensis TaxID=164393 RepID=UPI0039AF0E74
MINDYGQTELLTADLSEDEVVQVTNQQAEKTQLEAIVDQIAAIATETKAVLPDKPWLPPLATVIATPQIDFKTNWQQPRTTAAPLGLLDVPSKQSQITFNFDLETQGNTLIYSSPGFGKTTALQTLLMNFAKENTPAQMQFNLLDFGTNGLLPLKDLPHVADLVNLEQVEKLTKMLQRIREQLDDRKQAFQQAGVASLTQYEMSTKKQLPIIVNVIDSYDAALEDQQRDAIDSTLMQVLREGNSLGIYLVMTTSRSSGIRMAMLSNMATQLPLFLIDNDELRNIMGREYIQQQAFNGRGQLAVDEQVNAIQIYTPNPETETLAILQRLKEDVTVMAASWQGERPSVLPIVPSEFELAAFNHDQRVVEWVAAGKLPFGLALSDTAPLGFIPDQQAFFLIAHSTEEQLANIQKVLFAQFKALAKTKALFIVDLESELKEQHDLFNQVFTNDLEDIAALKQLMADYVQAATENRRLESAIMYIADLEQFFKGTNFNLADFKLTIQKGRQAGLSIIIQSPENYVGRSFDPYAPGIREIVSARLVMAKLSETNLIQATGSTMAGQLAENEAYYFESKGRKYAKMRFAGQK